MTDCLFCRIARGEVPATLVDENSEVLAFRDINPQAPVHVLIIPREHVESADTLEPGHDAMWSALLRMAQRVARAEGVEANGYRIVTNVGRDGGQTVSHLHLHLLGGRALTWPPG